MKRRFMLQQSLTALLLAACGKQLGGSEPSNVHAADALPMRDPAIVTPSAGPPAPELIGGGEWINSKPLTLAQLRGQVVMVSFWTYGCINCQNTIPSHRTWWDRYQQHGFLIIGVHTPEFPHEHELANVAEAVKQDQIGWPVVLDNEYAIWNAYHNHYWPHVYLVDRQGGIVYDHIGEGAYAVTEAAIQAALG